MTRNQRVTIKSNSHDDLEAEFQAIAKRNLPELSNLDAFNSETLAVSPKKVQAKQPSPKKIRLPSVEAALKHSGLIKRSYNDNSIVMSAADRVLVNYFNDSIQNCSDQYRNHRRYTNNTYHGKTNSHHTPAHPTHYNPLTAMSATSPKHTTGVFTMNAGISPNYILKNNYHNQPVPSSPPALPVLNSPTAIEAIQSIRKSPMNLGDRLAHKMVEQAVAHAAADYEQKCQEAKKAASNNNNNNTSGSSHHTSVRTQMKLQLSKVLHPAHVRMRANKEWFFLEDNSCEDPQVFAQSHRVRQITKLLQAQREKAAKAASSATVNGNNYVLTRQFSQGSSTFGAQPQNYTSSSCFSQQRPAPIDTAVSAFPMHSGCRLVPVQNSPLCKDFPIVPPSGTALVDRHVSLAQMQMKHRMTLSEQSTVALSSSEGPTHSPIMTAMPVRYQHTN